MLGPILIFSFTIAFGFVAIGCTVGWAVNHNNDKSIRSGTCFIKTHFPILTEQCSHYICISNECYTDYYHCYTASIELDVFDNDILIISNKTFLVSIKVDLYKVAQAIQNSYPLYSKMGCYYKIKREDIPTGEIQFKDPYGPIFITALIFWIFFGSFMVIIGILACIKCIC